MLIPEICLSTKMTIKNKTCLSVQNKYNISPMVYFQPPPPAGPPGTIVTKMRDAVSETYLCKLSATSIHQCWRWVPNRQLNPLDSKGNYSAVDGWAVTFGTARRGLGRLQPHPVTVPNVTAHSSTASVPITRNHCIAMWWSAALWF